MKRATFHVIILSLLVGLSTTFLAAQESGQITGTVTDVSKAVIPNAKVTAKSVETEAVRNTTTGPGGSYIITNLQPGVYSVTVEATGFSKSVKRAQVTVGSKVSLDFGLEVGKEVQVVEVVAGAAGVQVNTETQTMSQVISTKQILELPTLTRNPYALVATSGNVSEDSPDGRGAGFSINGARSASTNLLLDGVPNNDEFGAGIGQTVPLDSVQEFSILTSNFTAEFGRASGGIVNVATKSGSNELHGSAYEFNRVAALASNSFDNNANGLKKSEFTRNQFGYSVGGPVIKNKLFFFESTEWNRIRSSATHTAWVPDAALIAQTSAATKAFFAPYKLRSGLTTLATYTKATFAANGLNPCKGGATAGPCNALSSTLPLFDKVAYSVPADSGAGSPSNNYFLVGKVNYNFSEKTQMSVRYGLESDNLFPGTNADSPWAGFDAGSGQKNNSVLYQLTRAWSPTLVQESKISFNRFNNKQPLGDQTVVPSLYMGGNGSSFLGTAVGLPGYLPFTPGNGIPFGGPQNFVQTNHDVSKTIGRHTVRLGGQYTYIRDNRSFGAYEEANLTLGNNVGVDMDNLLNGVIRQFQAAVYPQGKFPGQTLTLPVGPPNFSRSNRYHEFALYAQDSYKVAPHVTVNLGVRWEYYGVQHNKDPKLDSNFYDGTSGNIFNDIRAGQLLLAPNSPVGGLWSKDFKDFAPRVGIAWDVFGDGKTALRGGYGIGYERNFGNVTFNVIQNPPNYAVVSLIAGTDVPTIPLTLSNAGPLAGTSGTKVLPATSLRNVNSNIKTAYAHLLSASLEHEFTAEHFRGVLMALEYSGSFGERLYTIENPNRPGAGNVYLNDACTPGACSSRLNNGMYTNINRRGGNGVSNYNSMNFRTDIRSLASHGLNFRINWTWSHAFDNLSDTFSSSGNQYNLGLTDPFNPQLDRGAAQFDNRHRLAISGTWDVPFARNTQGIARTILHGWVLAPIISARTGAPFTLYDTTNSANVYPRAVPTGKASFTRSGGPLTPTGNPNEWNFIALPAAAFDSNYVNAKTQTSDFGPYPASMLPRDFMRGPGAWNVDLGIYKNTKITERFSVQLRGEMYNMFNHANLFVESGNADVGNGPGVPILAFRNGRRNVQMAIKLIF